MRFARIAHIEGLPMALEFVCMRILEYIVGYNRAWVTMARMKDREFDRRFGVDTSGIIELETHGITPKQRASGSSYVGVSPRAFGAAIGRLPVNPSEFTFVDFGSGKCRAVLLAAQFLFGRIIGIELSEDLVQVCQSNIRLFTSDSCRLESIEVYRGDATEFELPMEPLVLFFFNPFSAEPMAKVARRIELSLLALPREVYVVYINPLHSAVFDSSEAFRKIFENPLYPFYSIYRSNF
jgi:hypothetical protein